MEFGAEVVFYAGAPEDRDRVRGFSFCGLRCCQDWNKSTEHCGQEMASHRAEIVAQQATPFLGLGFRV